MRRFLLTYFLTLLLPPIAIAQANAEALSNDPRVQAHASLITRTLTDKIKISFVEGSSSETTHRVNFVIRTENLTDKPIRVAEFTDGVLRFLNPEVYFSGKPDYPEGLLFVTLDAFSAVIQPNKEGRIGVFIYGDIKTFTQRIDGYLIFAQPEGILLTVKLDGNITPEPARD